MGKGGMPRDFDPKQNGIRKLRSVNRGGSIWATFADDAPSFEDYCGPEVLAEIDHMLPGKKLKLLGYSRQLIPSNWKMYLENLKDPYHATLLHTFYITFGLWRADSKSECIPTGGGAHSVMVSHNEGKKKTEATSEMSRFRDDLELLDLETVTPRAEFNRGRVGGAWVFPAAQFGIQANSLKTRHVIPRSPTEHELVFTGLAPNLDLARITDDVRRICETQIAFFEPRGKRAPFLDSADRYVFMTMVTGDGYGGLEHRASTALMTARKDLPVLGQQGQGEGYRGFLGLVSHEYFHTWNVKRIKPQAFVPYHLAQPDLTRLLWVFEGFTSYYDDLLLLRSTAITQNDYLRLLAKTITSVARTPGRHKQSVAESSFDAWTRYYKQDENSPNALVSYYTKGALVALGLDLLIRQESAGAHSLDDVMRLLWQRYGRDFYRGKPQGLPEDGLPALIKEATGVDARRFIARHAYGTADVPLAELLAAQGVKLQWKASVNIPSLDVRTRKQGDSLVLATVLEGGAGHRGGLSAGDVLVAIDGLKVEGAAGVEVLLGQYRVGDRVSVHVFRRDELRMFQVRLSGPEALDCVLSVG
jgi:predicted metalloprotease with PDZ domain